ncbi:MAG: hypothetical protein ACPGO5_04525 [Patescibacteria group bacterium]
MSTNKYLVFAIAVVVVASGLSLFSVVRSSWYGADAQVDTSLTVKGGAALNTDLSAANGLLVYGGNVGIGELSPDEKLVVVGEALFGNSQNIRISDGGVAHYETSDAGGSTYWSYNDKCACNLLTHEDEDGNRLVDFGQSRMSMAFMNVMDSLLEIPEAAAVPDCYATIGECQALGCDYCDDEGISCDPGEYACTISCDESHSGSPVDASCNAGDTETDANWGKCWGTDFKWSVKCLASTAYEDYFTKMEFLGSPEAGAPKRVIINDNIVADDNVYGDGDSSNGSECAWETDNECDNNRFLAGYDNSTDQIYCCEL